MTEPVKRITPCPPGFSDHIFKEAHGVSIPLRLWPAKHGVKNAPWLFWMHGGGFVAGKHVIPNAWVYEAFHGRNYHLVSVAYRFSPQVGLDEIIHDVKDGFAWCRSNLPNLLGHRTIDLDAYVVAGDSAGGTLSTLCGHMLSPRPRVVIDVFGVTDLTDRHYHERPKGASLEGKLADPSNQSYTDKELEKEMMDRSPEKAETICAWSWEIEPEMSVENLRVFWGLPDYTPGDKEAMRMALLGYMGERKKGMWVLLRGEECEGDEEKLQKRYREHSSMHLLDKDKGYPPTFFLHGEADTAVPVDQSKRFAEKLRGIGVETGERYKPGAGHSFDAVIERPGDDGWDEYIVPCMDFVDKHVREVPKGQQADVMTQQGKVQEAQAVAQNQQSGAQSPQAAAPPVSAGRRCMIQ